MSCFFVVLFCRLKRIYSRGQKNLKGEMNVLSLAELQKVQREMEEKRKAEAEAKARQKSNLNEFHAHFKEENGRLWLIVKAQVEAQETAKGNIALHNTVWRRVKTAEGIDIVIPSFNPFISMK